MQKTAYILSHIESNNAFIIWAEIYVEKGQHVTARITCDRCKRYYQSSRTERYDIPAALLGANTEWQKEHKNGQCEWPNNQISIL